NGDGLDLESCNRCIIKNSTFDVGDDAICIKSGKDKEGRDWKMPCQNVIIEGCTVLHGHGGFVIGSEMSSGARNIYVYNCLFNGTDTGLRMKSTRGRGGVVEKIYVDKINMVNIAGEAFTFSLYYANKPVAGKQDGDTSSADAVPPVTEETPCFRDLHISNITCQGARRAVYFNGLPEMPLSDVVLENSLFVCDEGADMHYAKNITFKNVKIQQKRGERITMADVKNFKEK
ncbi:MAG: glycoside hydrolase family 28 protein, partial [Bacteroidaceae bacterium]|nr:glycoside hydrolase family 28 protein [Bacteroidaceae bacterium]